MEQKINLNWEFEYSLLKKNVAKYREECENIIEQIKSTDPKCKEKINKLVNTYNDRREAEQAVWIQMVDFCKHKSIYKKHYSSIISKLLNFEKTKK